MDIYEFIGFYIGDGNIYSHKSRKIYRLELVGNVEEDYDYFNQLEEFIIKTTNKKPLKFVRKDQKGKSLRIQFNNKEFVTKLLSFGFKSGKKTFDIKIPDSLLRREMMISILRGLFEADGCLYFSKSKLIKYPSYPRLEICSSSEGLVNQIKSFLESEGFKVYVKKPSKNNRAFYIQISGEKMLELWKSKVGFVSLKNKTKYNFWKTKGFYIPHTNLKSRLN